jgi:hypothetical protein
MKVGEKHRVQRRRVGEHRIVMPVLLPTITCPGCGAEVDLWTGGEETRCFVCDQAIYKKPHVDH